MGFTTSFWKRVRPARRVSQVNAGRRTLTELAAAFTRDGHDAYPGAIKAALGAAVRHRTNRHVSNQLEQDRAASNNGYDPWGIQEYRVSPTFCRVHDEVWNFLRPRSHRNEGVSRAQRWLRYLARTRILTDFFDGSINENTE